METVHQKLTNRQRLFVGFLLLLGTLISFGVIRFSNLQSIRSTPTAATKPGNTNGISNGGARP
jgi:hypothetical protein